MESWKVIPPKTPIRTVQITVNIVNTIIYFFFLPVLSINTPNNGEKITSRKLATAFEYDISVLAIWSWTSFEPIISFKYNGKNMVLILEENIVFAASYRAQASIGKEKYNAGPRNSCDCFFRCSIYNWPPLYHQNWFIHYMNGIEEHAF